MAKTVNPYCIVNYFYWETTGKQLSCQDCIMDCPCRCVVAIKD